MNRQDKYVVKKARKEFEALAAKQLRERKPKVPKKGFKSRIKLPTLQRGFSGHIKTLKQHGAREMERRKRQIACGQLKADNGLVA